MQIHGHYSHNGGPALGDVQGRADDRLRRVDGSSADDRIGDQVIVRRCDQRVMLSHLSPVPIDDLHHHEAVIDPADARHHLRV